jgi:ELWxxDGT repeat protein
VRDQLEGIAMSTTSVSNRSDPAPSLCTRVAVATLAVPLVGAVLFASPLTARGEVAGEPGFDDAASSSPHELTSLGADLYFVATDVAHGFELWRSDGTPGGTRLVRDIAPGPADSFPWPLIAAGDLLFFGAGADRELWRTDGAAEGTFRLMSPGSAAGATSLDELTAVDDTLFFTAMDPKTGVELWASDGSPEGTRLVRDIRPGPEHSEPRRLTSVGGRLFFTAMTGEVGGDTAGPGFGPELWTSDGTAAGTERIKRFKSATDLTDAGGALYFVADDGKTGREPWTSDGTRSSTRLVKDVRPGKKSSKPRGFTHAGETVFFTANDGVSGDEVWATDGTADDTRLVRDIRPGQAGARSQPRLRFENVWMAGVGDQVFFPADDGETGAELWMSDGTAEGTRLVADVNPLDEASDD